MIDFSLLYRCPCCLREIPGVDMIVTGDCGFCPYCRFVVIAAERHAAPDDPDITSPPAAHSS